MVVLEGAFDTHGAREGARHAHGQSVLVVDDEERLRAVLTRILDQEAIHAESAPDAECALAMTLSGSYDLVILDLLMPERNGLDVLAEIMRRRPHQTVIVLSCLSDPESKVRAFDLGADDYICKPFHVGELRARVQARLRAAARPRPTALTCGSLKLDVLRRQADAGTGPVSLTSRECQVLWELMRQPGVVVSKDDLLARVWESDPGYASNVVDVYIRRLRARLGHDVISTVRGSGYCVRES